MGYKNKVVNYSLRQVMINKEIIKNRRYMLCQVLVRKVNLIENAVRRNLETHRTSSKQLLIKITQLLRLIVSVYKLVTHIKQISAMEVTLQYRSTMP